MASIFHSITDRTQGVKKSSDWYRKQVQSIASKATSRKLMGQGKLIGRPSSGRLNMFFYDPKLKDVLPYYDIFPLVLPLQSAPGGFLGCNFHYLAPGVRFRLLETLQRFANDNTFDSKTKLSVSYNAVKSIPFIKPTIKHYLWSYVRSSFLRIDMDEAPVSVYLPVQQFKKASAANVYAQSRKLY